MIVYLLICQNPCEMLLGTLFIYFYAGVTKFQKKKKFYRNAEKGRQHQRQIRLFPLCSSQCTQYVNDFFLPFSLLNIPEKLPHFISFKNFTFSEMLFFSTFCIFPWGLYHHGYLGYFYLLCVQLNQSSINGLVCEKTLFYEITIPCLIF